ncbi:lipase member H-B-like isoform X2 [Linepithema humile]|uniref:lipase member H-B-like isoform X2 n=1 Tax=Linepithema humile TaxID=83485 RepID=UPI00351F45D6
MLTSSIHFSYMFFLLFFVTRIVHSNKFCSCDQPDSDFATDVNFIYYKCNNETPATIAYPVTAPQDLMEVLEDKRVIFYIFGYMQFPEDPGVQYIMEALCYERTDNIILLDWSKYSNGSYQTVFKNAEIVGSLFAQGIRLLVDSGLDVSKIYIIGHSLGAHISGFAGKCNDFVIPRITGLDPANPMFYPFGCYLTAADAAWVDVIHTDRGIYGITTAMGTADFYANGGVRPQPGCKLINPILNFCSHQRSVTLYAVSKRQPKEFIAVQCSTYLRYMLTNCTNNLNTTIGYTASNVHGSFYFSTGIVEE